MDRHDVIVLGAGLAGLRAATRLATSGLDVVILEAEDAVGGRQRTDAVDGFLLDRGFQVLNPAYPAVRRWVDVDALGLRSFPIGVRVRREHGLVELAHPTRHPSRLRATLASGLLDPRELAALAAWAAPPIAAPRHTIHAARDGDDARLAEEWDRLGVDGPLRREVLEPFLAGVLAEGTGATSDAFVRLLVRMFALGRPGLPAGGIQALPEQLAASAQDAGAEVRLGHRAEGIAIDSDAARVDVVGGDPVHADAVIVAVGPEHVASLADVRAPATRGLQTWWLDAPASPTRSRMLHLDGTRSGPVLHAAVVSGTAPTYAPRGRFLVEATCLLGSATEADVRAQLRLVWGAEVETWRLLRRDDVRHALPAQAPPLRTTTRARVGERTYVAGDHRDTASIQGALASGDRVARRVLADLDA
ncbi:NAD(P)/FAD-dependent oxidoreductase [Agrococcus jejuensis]|uniref:Flavin containing amine oxidoreductase n=1 Tax=Agrococcus jejuensis TaxID=399736 RepID=A0A1G7ZZI8_9MICO|nr:NAD(P)/FAD-dependent oxidoreductase [Agrococcus jejuensis]SDH14098.1 Flavin containing amine oxidoreductase [Agrococcus jejuensis]